MFYMVFLVLTVDYYVVLVCGVIAAMGWRIWFISHWILKGPRKLNRIIIRYKGTVEKAVFFLRIDV